MPRLFTALIRAFSLLPFRRTSLLAAVLLVGGAWGAASPVSAQQTAASDSAASSPEVPAEQVLTRARRALNDGNYADALAAAHRLVSRDTLNLQAQSTGAYVVMGRALANTGRRDSAIVAFDRAIGTDPYFADAYHYRASVLVDQGRYADALRDTEEAVRLAPTKARILRQHAAVLYELERYDAAVETYGKILNLQPDNTEAMLLRAQAQFQAGDYEAAYFRAQDLIEALPNRPEPYQLKADALYATRQYEKAAAAYGEVIRVLKAQHAPPSRLAQAYNNRCQSHLGVNNYEPAIDDATQAIELDPDFLWPYRNRGVAYGELDERDAACTDFRTALSKGFTDRYGTEVREMYQQYCSSGDG